MSEVMLSKLKANSEIFRIDSEPFQKISHNSYGYETLRLDEICIINPSKTEIMSMDRNTEISFLPMALMGNGIINELEKGKIKNYISSGYSYFAENDILIAKITPCMEHGKCAIAQGLVNEIGFGSTEYNVFRLVDSRVNLYYLFAFLNREVIRKQAEIHMVGTSGRQRVPTSFYANLPIPVLPLNFQKNIEELLIQSYENLEISKQKYTEAETLLLENLGLTNFQAACNSVNVKLLKESFLQTGRLDAEYYQIKYEQYWNLIQSQDYVFIRDEYLHITEKPDWKNQPYQYIEIGDVNISDGSYQANCMEYQDLPENAKIKVKQGDILISTVRPYRGAVAIIGANDQDLVVSGAFTVLRKKPNSVFNNEVLKVLLRSKLYKDWLLQFNVGTSYPVIKDEDILNLPIPKIDETIQTQIANYIQQSNDLREKAKTLLAQAKSNVELEIENISLNINNLKDCGGG